MKTWLQNDIVSAVCWLTANRLWINVSKTETMLIGSRQKVGDQHLFITIADKPLCHVSVAKYLGVYIDQFLTWQKHVDYVMSKARHKFYSIKHIQWISTYLFSLLYQAFKIVIPLSSVKQTRLWNVYILGLHL